MTAVETEGVSAETPRRLDRAIVAACGVICLACSLGLSFLLDDHGYPVGSYNPPQRAAGQLGPVVTLWLIAAAMVTSLGGAALLFASGFHPDRRR